MKQIVLTLISGLVLATSGVMATEKTPDTDFNPFEEIRKMQKEMDSIFERFHQKMITLPEDANAEKFESEYKDGVLKITIPKKKK